MSDQHPCALEALFATMHYINWYLHLHLHVLQCIGMQPFLTLPSFWRYLAPINISNLKWFKSYHINKQAQTHSQTHRQTLSWKQYYRRNTIADNYPALCETCLKTAKATSAGQCDVADVRRTTRWFGFIYDQRRVTSVTSFRLFHLPEVLQSLNHVHCTQHKTCLQGEAK